MLNAAPASSSVDLSEVYNYTDLLCVNETEVKDKKHAVTILSFLFRQRPYLDVVHWKILVQLKRLSFNFMRNFRYLVVSSLPWVVKG